MDYRTMTINLLRKLVSVGVGYKEIKKLVPEDEIKTLLTLAELEILFVNDYLDGGE